MVVLSSLVGLQCKTNFDMRRLRLKNWRFNENGRRKSKSAGTPTEAHVMWSAVCSYHNDCLLKTLSCDDEASWSWGTFELISSYPDLPGLRERDVLDRVRSGSQIIFKHFEKFYWYHFYCYSAESTPIYKVNEVGGSQVDGFACGSYITRWWNQVCSSRSRKRRKFTTVFWHYSSFTNIMDDKLLLNFGTKSQH